MRSDPARFALDPRTSSNDEQTLVSVCEPVVALGQSDIRLLKRVRGRHGSGVPLSSCPTAQLGNLVPVQV